MLFPRAPRENLRSPPTAVRRSLIPGKKHLCQSGAVQKRGCAKAGLCQSKAGPRCALGALRPAHQPTAAAALASGLLFTPRGEKVRKRKMRHAPPRGACPRCTERVRVRGWPPDIPETSGPAEAPACQPPRARPGRLRLREPSRCQAPHSPLTLARTAEPGSGGPCGCRMPSGRARRGDRAPGSRRAREAAEDSAGGGGAPPLQQPLRRVRSPRKVWRS